MTIKYFISKKFNPISLVSKIGYAISPLLSPFENKILKRYSNKKPTHPLVFIIGPPRTGSTILYQLLTNHYNVSYFDYLSDIFYKNPLIGSKFSAQVYKDRPHHAFTSEFGRTWKNSLHAPSECAEFWYRWLPKDEHYITKDDVSKQTINKIRRYLWSILNLFNRPLVIKNLNAGQRLSLLQVIEPNAKFIFIKRSTLYTAQSIYLARKKNHIRDDAWWSVKPKNYKELLKKDVMHRIVYQIAYINHQITEDLKHFPTQNIYSISYEQLCATPEKTVQQLGNFISPTLKRRSNTSLPEIKNHNQKLLDDLTFTKFKKIIEQLSPHLKNE